MRLPSASYDQPSRNASRLLNCYSTASLFKGPVEVQGNAGVVSSRALPAPGRGLAIQGGDLFALAGTSLYRVTDGVVIGSIPGGSTVMFAPGVSQLVTDSGYMYDGATVGALTDVDRPDFAAVDFVDGFLIYVELGTGRFGCSALNDSSSFDGLDFATAEARPDPLVTLKVSQRDVVLLGSDTTELWSNTGASGFPFERQAGGFIELGCLARLGVCVADNTLAMLASDRTIRMLRGRTWVKVSQSGVEEAISSYVTLADCEAYSYTWNGHIFCCFRFPSGGVDGNGITWAFDVTTGEWHERNTDWVSAIHHDGKVWVQHISGDVGYLSDAVQSEWGNSVIREITFPNVYSNNKRTFHSSLKLVFRTGDVDPGVDPSVQLDISDDGGNTWTSLPTRSMGLVGKYAHQIWWYRLGSARDRVYRVRVSDAVPFYLTDAQLEVVDGN